MKIQQAIDKTISILFIYLMLNCGAVFYYLLLYKSPDEKVDSSNAVIEKPKQEIYRIGSVIYFNGYITESSVTSAFDLIDEGDVTELVVNSGGGNTEYAMDLAEWMLGENIKLTVDELCFSSCANYFMPAAESILIKQGSLVGWHGGAHQKEWGAYPWFIDVFPLFKVLRWWRMNEWKERERVFYESADIHKYINVIGQHEDYIGRGFAYPELPRSGWNYDSETLKLLGFENIEIEDGNLISDKNDVSIRVNQLSLTESELIKFIY